MITLYICEKCECPALVVWGKSGQQLCRDCAAKLEGRISGQSGSAVGDPLIRVIMPNGKQIEMAVSEGRATVKMDGKEAVFSEPAVLVGARRKIRS